MSEEQAGGADVRPEGEDPEAEFRATHKELLQELETKYDEIRVLRAPKSLGGGPIVIATPKRTVYQKFVVDIRNEKMSAPIVSEALAYGSVVYPDRETLKQYFETKPGLPLLISAMAQQLAVGDAEDLGKG